MIEEATFLYCVTLFTFAVIFALCYLRYLFTFFERNRIKAAASAPNFPWGNIKDVIYRERALFLLLWKYYIRIKKKAAKIGGFYIFFKPSYVIVDRNLIPHLENEENFAKSNFEDQSLRMKKREVVDFIMKSLVESAETLNSGEFEINKFLKKFVTDNNFTFSSEKYHNEFEKLSKEEQGTSFRQIVQLVYPSLGQLIPCGTHSKNKLNQLIEIEQTNRKKNDVRKYDLIRILTNDDDVTAILDYVEICVNLISFCLHEISINQEIQDDLRGEILRFLKTAPLPLNKLTIEDIKDTPKLSYLQSVICETLRKFPPKPFISRKCRKNHQFTSDLKMDAGSLVFVPIFGLHHDPENYTNPEMFDPDRFSEENIEFVGSNKYLPFGYSPSTEETTWLKTVMQVGLISLLSRFKFSLGQKAKKGLNFDEVSLGIRPKDGLWFSLESLT